MRFIGGTPRSSSVEPSLAEQAHSIALELQHAEREALHKLHSLTNNLPLSDARARTEYGTDLPTDAAFIGFCVVAWRHWDFAMDDTCEGWNAELDTENAADIAARDRLCVLSCAIGTLGAFATLLGVGSIPFLAWLAPSTTVIGGKVATLWGESVVPLLLVLAPACWFASCFVGWLAIRKIGLYRYRSPAKKLAYIGILLSVCSVIAPIVYVLVDWFAYHRILGMSPPLFG